MPRLRELKNLMSDIAEEGQVLTIQPGGNHGDTLIYKGAEKMFGEAGIETIPLREGDIRSDSPPPFGVNGVGGIYNSFRRIVRELQFLKHRFDDEIAAVYIHGGGNFNDLWKAGVRIFEVAVRYFNVPIVIGPQSCYFTQTDPDSLFSDITNQVHFFCRERYSYDIMSSIDSKENIEIYLEDDTAFYLDENDLPIQALEQEYSLVAFRTDKESSGIMIDKPISPPVLVRDISLSESGFERFINTAAKSNQIYTDRLHVAVLAALLEKPVRFYGNAYHKNAGVYEQSLQDFENVEFVDQ